MKISKLYLLLSVLFFSGLYCMEVDKNTIKILAGEEGKEQKEFEVDLAVAKMSVTIKSMLEDLPSEKDVAIPIQNLTPNQAELAFKAMKKLHELGYKPEEEYSEEKLE